MSEDLRGHYQRIWNQRTSVRSIVFSQILGQLEMMTVI